jgi:NitT/TauT family transport system substrate-binding protein
VIRSTGATFEPLFLAQNQGIFTKHGLKVKLIEAAAGGGSTSVPRVLKGEAQFAAADIAGLDSAVAQGLPVKATVTTQLSTSTDPVSDGLLVPKGSPIKSYADLAGKKVGLSALGGFPQAFVTIGAQKAGVAVDKIQFVQLPTASLTDAAKKGTVDAIISFASFYDAAKSSGMTPIGNGSNDLPGVPQSLFFASTQWLAKNQATAKKFGEAMQEAFTYANAHTDEVRAIDKKYTQLSASYIGSRTIQKFGGTPDKDQTKAVADALVDLKAISKAPSYDDLYWDAS